MPLLMKPGAARAVAIIIICFLLVYRYVSTIHYVAPKLTKKAGINSGETTTTRTAVVTDHDDAHAEQDGGSEAAAKTLQQEVRRDEEQEGVALFTTDHFQSVGSKLARAFPEAVSVPWCTSNPLRKRGKKDPKEFVHNSTTRKYVYVHPEGLLYNKVPKTGSTTINGLTQRISRNYAKRHFNNNSSSNSTSSSSSRCTVLDDHLQPANAHYGNRVIGKSFLFGSVRDPASRAVSRVFYFWVSQRGRISTDKNIRSLLENYSSQFGSVSDGQGGFQLRYLSLSAIPNKSAWQPEQPTSVINPGTVAAHVRKVIEDYDFMIVSERIPESFVALQLLLGLDAGDIITTSGRVGGGYLAKPRRKRCIKLRKSVVSNSTQSYLDSDEWYAKNYGDYLLHAAANKSLDVTIEQLGRDRFNTALAEFYRLKQLEKDVCADRAMYPCSADGKLQLHLSGPDCYVGDAGCGYPCIDEMLLKDAANRTK